MKKVCKECGIEKPINKFHRNPRLRDGRLNQCVTCTSARRLRNRNHGKSNDYEKKLREQESRMNQLLHKLMMNWRIPA